jgi:hypothetical protein
LLAMLLHTQVSHSLMQLVQLPHTLLVSSQLVFSEAQLVLSFTTPTEPLSQLMSPLLLQHELTI